MPHFSIAGLQLDLKNQDNTRLVEAETRRAKLRFPWVDMIVAPELALFGPNPSHALPIPNEVEARFAALAKELDCWIIPGTLFERDGDRILNYAPVFNPAGEIVLRYRKMFPFLPYEEGVSSGSEWGIFDVPGVGRFGLSICYDMWFPETTRTLAWMGAEVLIHPSMTNTIDRDAEHAIARSNAASNQLYVLDFNIGGDLGCGRSVVYGPGGEIVYEAFAGREVIAIDLDLDHVRRTRERGWNGLGQPLKSFRDSVVEFPAYSVADRRSPTLEELGPLVKPGKSNC